MMSLYPEGLKKKEAYNTKVGTVPFVKSNFNFLPKEFNDIKQKIILSQKKSYVPVFYKYLSLLLVSVLETLTKSKLFLKIILNKKMFKK